MESLKLLQEIEAWLSFNQEPSKEELAKLRNDISEQLNIAGVIASASFKKLIEEAIESAKDTDWCWNGEDEYPVTIFDIEIATNKVIEVLQQHLL